MKTRAHMPLLLLAVAALGLTGCAAIRALTEAGTAVARDAGVITEGQANALNSALKATEALTPENEHYIGRAVGANILTSYKPFEHPAATLYLNTLGQALAVVSDLPQTFGGYHFLILDSDEVNAFAAPGGLIFISRGMLRLCKNETSLAAVLAHEIGHVQHQHGLASIKKGRITQATVNLLSEGAKLAMDSEEVRMLTDQLTDSIDDIMKTMVVEGYSRSAERESDMAAVTILNRLGYNPAGLLDMLAEMDKHVTVGGPGFGKTHPPPKDRISLLRKQLDTPQPIVENERVRTRFATAMSGI